MLPTREIRLLNNACSCDFKKEKNKLLFVANCSPNDGLVVDLLDVDVVGVLNGNMLGLVLGAVLGALDR